MLALSLHTSPTLAEPASAVSARLAFEQRQYPQALQLYSETAQASTGTLQTDYWLLAAEAAFLSNQPETVLNLLGKVPSSGISVPQAVRSNVLKAEVALSKNDPFLALRLLPNTTDPLFQSRIELIRARAQFRSNQAIAAVQSLVRRERYLSEANETTDNREALWNGLTSTRLLSSLPEQLAKMDDKTSRGWLELALLAQQSASLERYENWRQSYPDHPGQERLATLMVSPATAESLRLPSQSDPKHVGLLLPTTGGGAIASAALREGVAWAAEQAGGGLRVSIFDTAGGWFRAYQAALDAGVGVVIGPLKKDEVAGLSALGAPPVPVLALNFLESLSAPERFYQMGLSPEDEASALVRLALSEGKMRAVVIVPEGDRGSRLARRFESEMLNAGGTVAVTSSFALGQRDYGALVKALPTVLPEVTALSLSPEKATAPAIKPAAAKAQIDADAIFIAARPQTAQLIWSQLRYRGYKGTGYVTAEANDGKPNRDMVGLRTCDGAWMLPNDMKAALNAPPERQNDRFFALGLDAFSAARRMVESPDAAVAFEGWTGTLIEDNNRALHRQLSCVEMTRTGLKMLP